MAAEGSRKYTFAELYLSQKPPDIERSLAVNQNVDVPKPKTLIRSGGKKKKLFSDNGARTPQKLAKWWNIYENGGLYAQAIDMYAFATFANGWYLDGKESFVQEIEDNFAMFDFDTVGMAGIIHSLVFGDSFQEAAPGRRGGAIPVAIMIRDSSTFEIDDDETGAIRGYTQSITEGVMTKTIKLKPEQIVHLQLISSADKYGISLVGRAYDEIMRDTRTAEASAEAIDRHGFKKYHIAVGQPGELIDQTVIDKVSDEFEDITTKNEFTTNADVSINELDEGGLEKIEDYNNISMMRVCAALGIPEELLGVRRGTTDATAVSRIQAFLQNKISSIQRKIARRYTLDYIDRIVPSGEVKLVFNDVSEEDDLKRATGIANLLGALARSSPEVLPEIFSVFPKEWIQKKFGIKADIPEIPKPKIVQESIK